MRPFKLTLTLSALALAILLLFSPSAQAGRLGGPAAEVGTVPAFQSVSFDVPFTVGTAVVSVAGTGSMDLGLYMYDGDGNVSVGTGLGTRKTVTMDVYRAGFFRVELRNPSAVAALVVVGTN
jgi:hypothetical protein